MKAEDVREEAFEILASRNEPHALELIRISSNRLIEAVEGGKPRLVLFWDYELYLRDKGALVLMMRAQALRRRKRFLN